MLISYNVLLIYYKYVNVNYIFNSGSYIDLSFKFNKKIIYQSLCSSLIVLYYKSAFFSMPSKVVHYYHIITRLCE